VGSEMCIRDRVKIAVVRTDRIGDMVLTLPLCRAIRLYNHNAEVTVIASSYTKPLLSNNPFVDEALYIDEYDDGIKDIFKNNKYHIVFFPRPIFEEAKEAFRANIPTRVGSGYRLYSLLFNRRVYDHRKKGELHEAEYNVRMLSALTGETHSVALVKPYINEDDLKSVKRYLAGLGVTEQEKLIVIHPGTRGSAAEWNKENFRQLAAKLAIKPGYRVLVTGVADEAAKCEWVSSASGNVINLCDKLSLSQMIAMLSVSYLLMANSTGVIHLAAACGTPVVGLYPNTSHISGRRWKPYSENSIVLSPPPSTDAKENDDLNRIQVNTVFDAIESLL